MYISPAELEAAIEPREPAAITLRNLLECGVHFGHQTARWNPKMAPFIYGARNGIHIINLPRTISSWETARRAIVEVVSRGGSVLFVGTKKQAQDAVVTEARRCGAHYVSRRWLGGMMTNFQTIRKSIARMSKLEEILSEEERAQQDGTGSRYTKKERLMMSRERDKLYYSLGGIKDMYAAPQLMFVIDIRREDIAIREAKRLDIPVVALVDTNCDPTAVTHAIPSNDDGTRAVRLFCEAVADAVMEGRKVYNERKSAMEGGGDVQSSVRGRRSSRGADKGGAQATAAASSTTSEPAAESPAAEASETPDAGEAAGSKQE
ncbi:MAG: 30S ribosomal protein S2 [Bdellovibrionales bacterium]|nr:30S ribosomal protein S2 [Bdellovibrionales bacterium]